MYFAYERRLDDDSRDLTADEPPVRIETRGPSGDGSAITDDPDAELSIDYLAPEQEPAWEAFVASHDRGDVYHTLAWRSVTEEGLGHKPLYLRAADRDGRIAGALPLFLVNGLFGRRLVSVPMRDRGGVIARDARTASRLVRSAIELTRELNCKYLELRSLHPIDADVVREHDLRCERYWTTTRIDLSPGVDALWKALDRDAIRWGIGKARKQGLRIAIDDTPAGVDLFYELFVRTRCAMGIPPFPPELVRAIHRHMISRGKAKLFVVYKDDVPVHAMVNLISRDTFVPAYAAPQNAYRAFYPNEFMFWHTIEWAAQNGFRYYDFGADSPRQTGLLFFKKKWGGVQQPMLYCYYLNGADAPPSFDSTSPAYELARKVWSRMPVRMSKYLGSRVTRQFS
jgi:FemAB-related protein (PEP-CTERM system-associated)